MAAHQSNKLGCGGRKSSNTSMTTTMPVGRVAPSRTLRIVISLRSRYLLARSGSKMPHEASWMCGAQIFLSHRVTDLGNIIGACVHPMLGKPMRSAIGGGKSVIGSNVKVAAAGASLDVPLGHKDDPWSFLHFDTITVSIADAPRPDEIVVVYRYRGRRPPAQSVWDRADPIN
jgi:hypothetical protein